MSLFAACGVCFLPPAPLLQHPMHGGRGSAHVVRACRRLLQDFKADCERGVFEAQRPLGTQERHRELRALISSLRPAAGSSQAAGQLAQYGDAAATALVPPRPVGDVEEQQEAEFNRLSALVEAAGEQYEGNPSANEPSSPQRDRLGFVQGGRTLGEALCIAHAGNHGHNAASPMVATNCRSRAKHISGRSRLPDSPGGSSAAATLGRAATSIGGHAVR